MTEVKDTSQDYDDMTDYSADYEETDLSSFIDLEEEKQLKIKPKKIDPDYPEEWQTLIVNIVDEEAFFAFMKLIDMAPSPKTKKIVFEKNNNGLMEFFND